MASWSGLLVCAVLAACGSSAKTTQKQPRASGASATASAPATAAISSNAYLQQINTQCQAVMPTVADAVGSANDVIAGKASSASSVVSQAATDIMSLNSTTEPAITQYDATAGASGNQSPGHWHAEIEVLYAQLMYFADPQSGPTTPEAGATALIRVANDVNRLASASQMPACSITSGTSGASTIGAATSQTSATGTANTGATTSTPAVTASPSFGPACGTVTGGPNDYQGAKLTVHATKGVSCSTAMTIIGNLSAGKAQNHQGPDQASSYFTLDGWRCPYGNMDTQYCEKGALQIIAYAPGAQP